MFANMRSASGVVIVALALLPVVVYASGIFSFISDIFSTKTSLAFDENYSNSQNIALLQAAPSPDGEDSAQSDVSIVGDNSLIALSPDPLASTTQGSDQISIYVVHPGDTLSGIAKMFNVSVNTIVWANDIKSGKITIGDQLVILPISGVEYTVTSGDTLQSIAKKFNGDVGEIAQFNNLATDVKLSPGDTVIIPDGELSSNESTVQHSSTSGVSSGGSSEPASGALPAPSGSPAVGSHGPSYPVYVGYYERPILGGIKTQGIHGHNAVDLASSYGTPIMASADGTVIVAKSGGWNGGYGSYIVLNHANGTQTLYAHLSQVNVSVGETVSQGQTIGHMGSTGDSTGNHLHFEIRGAPNPF